MGSYFFDVQGDGKSELPAAVIVEGVATNIPKSIRDCPLISGIDLYIATYVQDA
jgi:hypothetical protein